MNFGETVACMRGVSVHGIIPAELHQTITSAVTVRLAQFALAHFALAHFALAHFAVVKGLEIGAEFEICCEGLDAGKLDMATQRVAIHSFDFFPVRSGIH
jgi:hypothetical protein